LASEFAKVPTVRPLRSISAWCIFVTYLLVPAGFVCPILAKMRQTDDSALLLTHVAMICAGYFAVLAFGMQASALTLSRLWGGPTTTQLVVLRWWGRVYFAIGFVGCLVGFLFGAIWTKERYGVYWSNDAREIGGVIMIAWTLGMLIRFRRIASPSLLDLVLGVAGNPVTVLSWFGAAYVSSQGWLTASFAKSTTFPNFMFVFMVAFFAIHGLLLMLTVAPLPRWGAAPMESNR
jgi:ABC-type transport system involved in cytochrome c biogenesis permease subunit